MNTLNTVLSALFRKRLDSRTSTRLTAIRIRSRGLARHGERETQVIPHVTMAALVARIDSEAVRS